MNCSQFCKHKISLVESAYKKRALSDVKKIMLSHELLIEASVLSIDMLGNFKKVGAIIYCKEKGLALPEVIERRENMNNEISMYVSVGEVKLSLYQLLQLQRGTKLPFEIRGGSEVEIIVGGELISRAEICQEGEQFSLTITEIVEEIEKECKEPALGTNTLQ